MRILCFGSLNIDHVYQVDHIARPGQSLPAHSYQVFAGGKGANQSAALALAGARVYHAGLVGPDGSWLVHTPSLEAVHLSPGSRGTAGAACVHP